jgi:Domain of unknown function (DUF4160)
MVTVLFKDGLRIAIYRDDHEPPHVHVYGDGETKVNLGNSPDDAEVIKFAPTKRTESRRAARLVRSNHAVLLACWSDLHG